MFTASMQRTSVHTGVGVEREWERVVDELSRHGFLDIVGAAAVLLGEAAGIRADLDDQADRDDRADRDEARKRPLL